MRALCFSESMELHRISLWFEFMVVRLVAEGDALLPQPRQPLAVDLNAVGSRDRCVIPENIAHVVEQPCGREQDRGRALLAAVDAIHEHSCVGMSAAICFREPLVSGICIFRNALAHEVQLSQQVLCIGVTVVCGLP